MADTTLPPFNSSFPPQDTDPNALGPDRTAYKVMGTFTVLPAEFGRVHDPAYPWVGMVHKTPAEFKKMKEIRDAQKKNVQSYIVTRAQYWRRISARTPGSVTEAMTHRRGTTVQRSHTETRTWEQTIGFELGLEISAGDKEGGGKGSAKFTAQFKQGLNIQDVELNIFTEETTFTRSYTFRAGILYIFWQLSETMWLTRVTASGSEDLKPDDAPDASPNRVYALTDRIDVVELPLKGTK